MTKTISCVIRTYNEAKYVGKLINTLRSQENIPTDLEIVVVDSGSTDATVEIARNEGVNLIEIPKAEFNYSKALNLGIEKSTGDLIVILSAHSIPREDGWLQRIIAHFEERTVAGVYCRQIPWPDADLFEFMRIERTFGDKPRSLSKETTNNDMNFSNAASCIRRSVWEKHPFVILPAAEDREWARWAIENGYTIVYEPKVAVYHSHKESCRKTAQRAVDLERSVDIHLKRKRNLFLTMKQAFGWIVRDIKRIFSENRFRGKHIICCLKSVVRGFWYVMDFNRKRQ